MVSLLLIISFLLHIVLLMAVYFLYQQLQLAKQNRDQELEALFATFLEEIKRENEFLQAQLSKQNQQQRKHTETMRERTDKETIVQNNFPDLQENNFASFHVEKQDKLETSIEGQVFQLYKQGESIEEIAKSLNRGKTEVELILKLQKKEERQT